MRLNTKTTLFSIALASVMLGALLILTLFSFRQFSMNAAQQHTTTAAEIIRVTLTQQMVNGTIDKRKQALRRLAQEVDLKKARVVRGPQVVEQFGAGLEREKPQDAVEKSVLNNGEPYFGLVEDAEEPTFRATIPFTATSSGQTNCLRCHDVPEGTVLGAVTLTTSIATLRNDALLTVGIMMAVIALFAVVLVFSFRRMTNPLVRTAQEVQDAVEHATKGDFSIRIRRRTSDEIGQIADDINKLSHFLQEGLSSVCDNVSRLLQRERKARGNLLADTTDMVEGLVRVNRFKQAIEEDEHTSDVYHRLSCVLTEEFGIERFSIYEVDSDKNRIVPVIVDAESSEEVRWCDPQIAVRAGACRAVRTGHTIDGVASPGICTMFAPGHEAAGNHHICLPLIQSGSVGSVVQLLPEPEQESGLRENLPLVEAYLREAAPVLEAKRLTDTLRESNLRDAMTGLNNRRFLEEYVDTLVATADRREQHITVLMLDCDYFKQVNDTYGHEAGDAVLKEIARAIQSSVRASDLVIRYGGEEFLVLLQDADGPNGAAVAEKIRETVEGLTIEIPGGKLNKTVSVGVAEYPEDADGLWQVIKYADVALYKAKDRGRNQVLHFDPSMWEEAGY
jgi:diguanylate cyclase (GGDEF)-like protein